MSRDIKSSLLKIRQILCLGSAAYYGSISKAAEKSGMKQSNFSSIIKDLELESGEKLLNRYNRGVDLTEAGAEFYVLSCELEKILGRTRCLNSKAFNISGAVRLWTSDGLGVGYLSKCFPAFYALYPKVNIDIICSLEMPQPEQFDMALLYEEPKGSSFTIIDKYDLQFGLFASKKYLSTYGFPKNLEDLKQNHRICTKENYLSVWKEWEDLLKNAACVATKTNSSSMLLGLVKDGIGIGLLPIGTAKQEETLVHLSKLKLNLSYRFWLVVRKDAYQTDKIKTLCQFIKDASEKL